MADEGSTPVVHILMIGLGMSMSDSTKILDK